MVSGFAVPTFETIRENYTAEQILAAFGYKTDSSFKCKCPFHDETIPSLFVNKDFVHCFGCGITYDNYALARALLEKERGSRPTVGQVFAWFQDTEFPAPALSNYPDGKSHYLGPVKPSLIEYWYEQMTEEKFEKLTEDRLITKETALLHRLGWRPDWEAWVIPFYRGARGTSEIDIVHFRLTKPDAKTKYAGLDGHYRGAVMNADLLVEPQPYVVVFFGSFDGILARQDGLVAVGLNGSNPFRKDEFDRVKELFGKQSCVFVVPDNTPQEVNPAYRLAELLGGTVKFFDAGLPLHTDYISYRKLGYSAEDFKRDVLDIAPLFPAPEDLLSNALELVLRGDPYNLVWAHVERLGRGILAQDLAREIASVPRPQVLTQTQWIDVQHALWRVVGLDDLYQTFDTIKANVYTNQGGW